ncbi:MAG TPA: DNA internalization-related competence protein ComEC/Rec2 [Gemmatimonadales bacterium]|nr:DNA internalization-related competence protein ComEC/Rec2 [Gemmatimonadales bacterium]
MSARPPILFLAAFGAGLATGLSFFPAPLGAALVLGAAALAALGGAWLAGPGLASLFAGAALLGALHGGVARARDRVACTARLPDGAVRLRVRLAEPVTDDGGRVQVLPVRAGCGGEVAARWPARRPADAGAEAEVEGRWLPRPGWAGRAGGMLLVSRVGALRTDPSPGERLRTAVARGTRELYGARAPIVEALIVGRRADLDPDLKDAFAWSGLVHLLSISGFHVGLIVAWVVLVGRLLRLSPVRALIAAALVAAGYVALLGWPAPATRAAALAGAIAWCRARQRNVQPDPLLAGTCLAVLLVDPWAVADLGAWLSAAALWGATTCTRWTDRALGPSLWWRCLGSSVGATVATAPLTAAALGTVALVGIALNFAAIPIAALAVPGVFASLLLLPVWHGLAAALAAGAGLALHALELLAMAGAAVPGGHLVTEAAPGAALPWLGALAVLLWGMRGRTTLAEGARRWAWAGVVALWLPLAGGLRPSPDGPGTLALDFLDVGQGDGAVLRTPHGRFVVIDAGPRTEQRDAGRRVVVPFLSRRAAPAISALIVSHAHADHVGGAAAVLDRFRTGLVIEPGRPFADPAYYRFLDEVAADGVPWHPGRPGDRFVLDGVAFTLLHPDTAWPGLGDDLNEDSLVLLVEFGSFRALFPGDAGFAAEAWLRGRVGPVSLLKVGHHGSRGSTGDAWLDELAPRAAVISVGRNNYGHPAAETLRRLDARGTDVRRTDRDGEIHVATDGATMTVRSKARAVTYVLRNQ